MDPVDVAQQLTLYEYRLYQKIRPRECINWAKTQKGETVANLANFCSTHDKLAAWVKLSVLCNDGLGKRADMIDFWIKVAEVSRQDSYSYRQCIYGIGTDGRLEMPGAQQFLVIKCHRRCTV